MTTYSDYFADMGQSIIGALNATIEELENTDFNDLRRRTALLEEIKKLEEALKNVRSDEKLRHDHEAAVATLKHQSAVDQIELDLKTAQLETERQKNALDREKFELEKQRLDDEYKFRYAELASKIDAENKKFALEERKFNHAIKVDIAQMENETNRLKLDAQRIATEAESRDKDRAAALKGAGINALTKFLGLSVIAAGFRKAEEEDEIVSPNTSKLIQSGLDLKL